MDDKFKRLLDIQKERESGIYGESIYSGNDPLAIEYQELRRKILHDRMSNKQQGIIKRILHYFKIG